jgi:protocatechuate 3,4-dioxygenase beta subunit
MKPGPYYQRDEITGPVFGHADIDPGDNDLLTNYASRRRSSPLASGSSCMAGCWTKRPADPEHLVEIWQANAGGRYRHRKDTYLAPIDPNFGGCGRTLTDENGGYYFPHREARRLPLAQPWSTTGARAYPRLGLWFGFCQRLITQLFRGRSADREMPDRPDDPRPGGDRAADRAALDINASIPLDTIAYKFDIVLRGRRSTLFENRPEGN